MSKKYALLAIVIIAALLVPFLPACRSTPVATAYTAVIPAILQSGSKQSIAVALFADEKPISGTVDLALLKDGQEISRAQGHIQGNGQVQLNIPEVAEGDYTLRVRGENFQNEAQVKVENNYLLFLETDKPIYKPGQTIRIRAMALDSELKPASENVTVEVLDAKGIKIFRQQTETDEYGLANLDLPISTEPNLGTWKINASTAKAKTELDVRVEEYVLPKYEVKVDLPRDWFLVSEPIKGKVTATYSFGKPVQGELKIQATKYVGTWQEYADLHLDINGEAEFTVPAAEYVAGVAEAGGNGNVKLAFIVTEKATGYEEKTDNLVTVSQSALNLSIIPSGSTFKPGLPYSFLVVSETPDNQLVDTRINASISYLDKDFREIKNEDREADTSKGKALFEINPPVKNIALVINCSAQDTSASKTIEAAYSPSGNFIHLEQTSAGTPNVGNDIQFYVYSTKEATNFYYEVISRGTVVFSDYGQKNEITLKTTPAMAPSAKLLVYQILPNSEVAADYLPFKVTANYPQNVQMELSTQEARPGDNVNINIQTEGEAEIGLAAVDKSVFILAENRMNLQQVFDELEKLYMNPQAELHSVSIYDGIDNRGTKEVFQDAGVIVLSNKTIPEGKKYESPMRNGRVMGGGGLKWAAEDAQGMVPPMMAPMPVAVASPAQATGGPGQGLAEVQRIRQFFPETWIWDMLKTDSAGKASLSYPVPDSITTWMLRAVALSKDKGLGIAESQLKVFQPFFLTVDLPYSVIRGEEFPVKVAVYNYLDQPQSVVVQIQSDDWFNLLDPSEKTVNIEANNIGGAEFTIKPTRLGNANEVKITARSAQAADAVIKPLIVEAEGVAREIIDNITLSDGKVSDFSTAVPSTIVEGSARAYFAVTSSYLTQTINGLESLIQMPFGCGEQNMIIFAPDVYITRYLKESGQLKPEIMAKAEKLMLTGYQRELTYRRSDGSFSAFGENDEQGSLWLTAFVMKCFSEAKGLIYIDDQVLDQARDWILSHQKSDGSFESVGFVHHQEMLGGLKGQAALTAYVAIALMEAGETGGSARAVSYLENQIDKTDDPYTVALITYALELAHSARSAVAHDKLMQLAKEDENGLHWGSDDVLPAETANPQPGRGIMPIRPRPQTSSLEATAYAALALIQHGDNLNASRAAKWLVSKRNANGGFGSTQDTVMALQALIEYSTGARADVDLNISLEAGGQTRNIRVTPQNFDVLTIVDLPINENVKISVQGKGEAIGQIVQRFNMPEVVQKKDDILKVNVSYDAQEVEINDEVKVDVDLSFNPPQPMEAGMVVLDVAVPTGFAAVKESIDKVVAGQDNIKRYDISGRKVIFYIENMFPGDKVAFSFMVKALYPVKAKAVASQAYSYYQPEITAESMGQDINVIN